MCPVYIVAKSVSVCHRTPPIKGQIISNITNMRQMFVMNSTQARDQICWIVNPVCHLLEFLCLVLLQIQALSVRFHSKSHRKSSKCQILLTKKNLWFLGGHQLKKTPCTFFAYLLLGRGAFKESPAIQDFPFLGTFYSTKMDEYLRQTQNKRKAFCRSNIHKWAFSQTTALYCFLKVYW